MDQPTKRLGQALVDKKVITESQLQEAMHKQRTTMSHRMIGEILIRLGYISNSMLIDTLRELAGKTTDLSNDDLMVDAAPATIEEQFTNDDMPRIDVINRGCPTVSIAIESIEGSSSIAKHCALGGCDIYRQPDESDEELAERAAQDIKQQIIRLLQSHKPSNLDYGITPADPETMDEENAKFLNEMTGNAKDDGSKELDPRKTTRVFVPQPDFPEVYEAFFNDAFPTPPPPPDRATMEYWQPKKPIEDLPDKLADLIGRTRGIFRVKPEESKFQKFLRKIGLRSEKPEAEAKIDIAEYLREQMRKAGDGLVDHIRQNLAGKEKS